MRGLYKAAFLISRSNRHEAATQRFACGLFNYCDFVCNIYTDWSNNIIRPISPSSHYSICLIHWHYTI